MEENTRKENTLLKKITFKGSQGDNLSASLILPSQKPRSYALFAHCFTCSKDSFAATRISQALAELGIATLRFDFTGLGGSEGDFANTNFSSNVEDILHAFTFMEANYHIPEILIGHSLGGAAILLAAQKLLGIKALVTIGAPSEVKHIQHLFSDNLEIIEAIGKAEVNLGGRKFLITKQFIDDLGNHALLDTLSELNIPLLIFHALEDTTVNISNGIELFNVAKLPKSFISLSGANHLLSRKHDAELVANFLSLWIKSMLTVDGKFSVNRSLSSKTDAESIVERNQDMAELIQHDKAAKKFVLMKDGKPSVLEYTTTSDDKVLDFHHTFVPPDLRGQHIGETIVKFALDYAKENGFQIIPTCPFVARFIERHQEYQSVVAKK